MIAADRRSPLLPAGTESLSPFAEAGLLTKAAVQVAGAIVRVLPGTEPEVLLAAALCVRSLRLGHVCLRLDEVAHMVLTDHDADPDGSDTLDSTETDRPSDVRTDAFDDSSDLGQAISELPWPDPSLWAKVLAGSAAVAVHDPITGAPVEPDDPTVLLPLVFDGTRVYLERYWRYERRVGDALLESTSSRTDHTDDSIKQVLDRYFGPLDGGDPDLQRQGASVALRRRVTVLAGGPGTGKTHTVARVLAAIHDLALDDGKAVKVALAAPTGKAAARMTEAVRQAADDTSFPSEVAARLRDTEGGTIHRLLGWHDSVSFRHDATNPLPHDVVVIDETSMVALPLMARLLDALKSDARLVLVGDPFQLASVEAGAVLGDIVGPAARSSVPLAGPLADDIVVLQRTHRFSSDSAIATLATAVRIGDADAAIAVLRDPESPEVAWIDPVDRGALAQLRHNVVSHAVGVVETARAGDVEAALARASELKVLCGTRFGQVGSYAWRDHIERHLSRSIAGLHTDSPWYIGRPVLVFRNDYIIGVFNGDTGLVVQSGDKVSVAIPGASGTRLFLPAQLADLETWWAMTIHKSQGSEFDHAVVALPDARSRVLTNELLYTGITRGKQAVTVVATESSLRAAIGRRVARASGLSARLWPEIS